jgi:hypothetical protein
MKILVVVVLMVLVFTGCSTLTIERTYGADQIASETIKTNGFFMNRAQKIQFAKSQDNNGAVDNLSTDMAEDASAARDALKDTLALAQFMAQIYISGFKSGASGTTVSPVTTTTDPKPCPILCPDCNSCEDCPDCISCK